MSRPNIFDSRIKKSVVESLEKELSLLKVILYRSKNQHRRTLYYKNTARVYKECTNHLNIDEIGDLSEIIRRDYSTSVGKCEVHLEKLRILIEMYAKTIDIGIVACKQHANQLMNHYFVQYCTVCLAALSRVINCLTHITLALYSLFNYIRKMEGIGEQFQLKNEALETVEAMKKLSNKATPMELTRPLKKTKH
mmetsp:Transcript_12286/g.18404  ORF Transcript_12286/g.18404 Transcript_12286/m.18404 type:complete len:194 (-) Transcript_12286:25-606(-)